MKTLLFILLMLLSNSAQALVEVRLNYGVQSIDPAALNTYMKEIGGPSLTRLSGLGADALVLLPAVPIGFGVRYEYLSTTQKSQSSSLNSEVSLKGGYSRVSLLVNYRLIDTGIFLGPIVSVGLANSAYANIKTNSDSSNYNTTLGSSYSLGAEGGVKLGTLLLGGELGYQYAKFSAPKYNHSKLRNSNGDDVGLDYGGFYFKVLVGFAL